MDKKYWVPALEKADHVLKAICEEPNKYRLIDLAAALGIHKSSMYSLLLTMEALGWVDKDRADTYSLGRTLGHFGSFYNLHNDLIRSFHREASASKAVIGETIQLGRLEGRDVLYLAKEEVPSRIRLASDPGMRFPAHATALGKALLSRLPGKELQSLYADDPAEELTPHTLRTREALFREVRLAGEQGFALDREESVIGFCCVAAPVCKARRGKAIAAVSCTMQLHLWDQKQQTALKEICALAERLSAF